MENNGSWKAPFFIFFSAQAVSLIGSGLASFAVIWWMTESTGSATILATAALVGMLPGIFIGPLAGALVDRWNRRLILIASDGVSALMAAALVVLFWTGLIQIWHIYVIIFIRSIAGAFQFPAVQSSTSLMVPKEQLARVAGYNQTLQGFTAIATPPLGALLLELLPLHAIQGIDVLTAITAIALLFVIRIPQPKAAEGQATPKTVLMDLRAGLVFLWRWPALIGIMVIASVLNLLLTPAFSLVPILVTRTFNGQALELAWMNAAYGIGMLAGGILLSIWGGFQRRIYTSVLGLAGLSLGALLIGIAPPSAFLLALGAMLIMGVVGPLINGPFFAILQATIPPEMQGRVFTVLISTSMGMSPVGLAVAGPLADRFGVQLWYLIGAVFSLIMCASILLIPALLHLEDGRPEDRPAKAGEVL